MEEYLKRMKEIAKNEDTEMAHGEADELLVEILNKHGYQELTKIFEDMNKWYA